MASTASGFTAGLPGFTAKRETVEANFTFQTFFYGDVVFDAAPVIASTAVDSGNTPTSILRPGLILGKLDSDGSWVQYSPTATDGSQEARGVLVTEVNMTDYTTGSAAARMGLGIVIAGKAKESMLVNLDYAARNQLAARGFILDGDNWGLSNCPRRRVMKAADYTVLATDHLSLFITKTGAVTFTLPTIAVGLTFWFLNGVDANMTIASAEGDNVIVDNDLSADSVAFSTSSHKIGGYVKMEAIYVDSTLKWLPTYLNGVSTNTVTTAS